MARKHSVLFGVLIVGGLAALGLAGVAYAHDDDPPSPAQIAFAEDVSTLLGNEVVAALFQDRTEPADRFEQALVHTLECRIGTPDRVTAAPRRSGCARLSCAHVRSDSDATKDVPRPRGAGSTRARVARVPQEMAALAASTAGAPLPATQDRP